MHHHHHRHRRRQIDCRWFVSLFTLVNGICVIVISSLFLEQSVNLLVEQRVQKAFKEDVHREPFKKSNWMKSAIPLIISAILGILVGLLQSISSIIMLILDNSKSAHLRNLGWLFWIAVGMCIFILSCISFVLAQILKAHEYRDPKDSASFWTNYRFKEVTHNFEGHAFCSALTLNSAALLASMVFVATRVFRNTHRENNHPHVLLGM